MNKKLDMVVQNTWVELAGRWLLAGIFLYACVHKILQPSYFAKIIYGYYLFPDFSINLFAITLPYIELFAGLCLIFGIYPRSAAIIIEGMLFSFIVAISINLIRGHEFDCGCFSFGEEGHSSPALQLLIRDVLYFIAGVPVLFFRGRRMLCLKQTGSILSDR